MGCGPAPQPRNADETEKPEAPRITDDASAAAEAALGKQAEVLAHGNLARNGLEQLLVVNRFAAASKADAGSKDAESAYITRATILEKRGSQWTEILRCDERLKNPIGYLGGTPSGRVNGWRLEIKPDTAQGLEMKFTPASFEAGGQDSGTGEPGGQPVVVRWNKDAKRYQSLNASHERYLSEAPSLETPHSTLR